MCHHKQATLDFAIKWAWKKFGGDITRTSWNSLKKKIKKQIIKRTEEGSKKTKKNQKLLTRILNKLDETQ